MNNRRCIAEPGAEKEVETDRVEVWACLISDEDFDPRCYYDFVYPDRTWESVEQARG